MWVSGMGGTGGNSWRPRQKEEEDRRETNDPLSRKYQRAQATGLPTGDDIPKAGLTDLKTETIRITSRYHVINIQKNV
ncbi:hypothetical protein V1477_018574 [Vespula maculifrons]|uniref:Uncharacterized protein n=1 Tax=Vespula maculifrons TaxID=7453 RepID=A0ABD2AVR3_VESMC